ncbi:hypothetical protein K373_02113 [Streptomyces sp. DvalAA-21]|nr:hypothetical protein SACTE_2950 [Streptomyces sp. SirexAA-E]PZX41884.1 hypothetical protein K373_02113 [Streptomyces sp. DvalAA-21]RAJ38281.1 hypothetical protein K351_01860 [Streptomyces sp. DpondAA-E10]RAJ52129.1 hypothetical protein K352_01256 [Streptomyces sp. DpondAA-A50]SCD70046.1 hypothetical protein GA0115235_10612 [Streptomyces sp. DpondAA-F4a]SCM13667.1 hypothetical protein SAMN04883147_109737 [Streptomyces sp. DpondAA-F4]
MLRTTDPTTKPAPALPVLPAGTDPLLHLQNEMQPADGPGATRCLSHPHELALGGIPVMCSTCRARRDWLLLNHGRNVWVHCRCGNQWLEPEISRADFDGLIGTPDVTNYPSIEQALTALGFDGAFAGTYLE